jgi:hypothetical protein
MTHGDRHTSELSEVDSLDDLAAELEKLRNARNKGAVTIPSRPSTHVNADESNVEQGLAQLVLSLVELLRQLLEKQALRRMEAGTLNDEEIERLGVTFMKLQERMEFLKETFGLEDNDLNIDLGPLGSLVEEQSPLQRRE